MFANTSDEYSYTVNHSINTYVFQQQRIIVYIIIYITLHVQTHIMIHLSYIPIRKYLPLKYYSS